MDSFKSLARQHREILDLAAKIKRMCADAPLTADYGSSLWETTLKKLRNSLVVLIGKLKIHILIEDNYLYPLLFSATEPEVKILAVNYSSEMEAFKPMLEGFAATKLEPDSIRNAPPQFIHETLQIIDALEQRIETENQNLYGLFLSEPEKREIRFAKAR